MSKLTQAPSFCGNSTLWILPARACVHVPSIFTLPGLIISFDPVLQRVDLVLLR